MSLSVFYTNVFLPKYIELSMNVTFSSTCKKTIIYIVNYLYSRKLTKENIVYHIKYLQNKCNVMTTFNDLPVGRKVCLQTTEPRIYYM